MYVYSFSLLMTVQPKTEKREDQRTMTTSAAKVQQQPRALWNELVSFTARDAWRVFEMLRCV